jgi:hypothetical protein
MPDRLPIPLIFRAVLAQLLALALWWLIDPPISPLLLLLATGGSAWVFSLAGPLSLPPWWWPIQLLAPLGVALALALQLPALFWLGAFVLLWLITPHAFGERVPLYLTNRQTIAALVQRLPATPFHFVDLGGGTASVVVALARQRDDCHFTAVESAWLPWLIAWLRLAWQPQGNVTLRLGNFWSLPLCRYQVIYAFLSPQPMDRLMAKAAAEMAEGALFISNTFLPATVAADESWRVGDRRQSELHLFHAATLRRAFNIVPAGNDTSR